MTPKMSTFQFPGKDSVWAEEITEWGDLINYLSELNVIDYLWKWKRAGRWGQRNAMWTGLAWPWLLWSLEGVITAKESTLKTNSDLKAPDDTEPCRHLSFSPIRYLGRISALSVHGDKFILFKVTMFILIHYSSNRIWNQHSQPIHSAGLESWMGKWTKT